MNIAIAGYGTEGKVSYQYWRDRGDAVTIVDERANIEVPEGAKTLLGEGVFGQLGDFDMVVRTAGLAPHKLAGAKKIWSATNEFFARCDERNVPIIGVTGTKGKGTTSSFIHSILTAAGRDAHLVGNIGMPALEILPQLTSESIVVYELSSFQLWDLERSPRIAVVLPIEPDHLDVHASFDEYVAAKSNIVAHQRPDDIVVYHRGNETARQIAERSLAKKHQYPAPIDGFASSIQLPGAHNHENASAAICVAREYDIDDEAIRRGLVAFTGLSHRLKFVAEKSGVRYFNDSIGTTPGSSIAALRSFSAPKILILGGSDKGADYSNIVAVCAETQTKVVAIGQTGQVIAALAEKNGVRCQRIEGMMPEVVNAAAAMARPGDVVILSPASASFDQYDNYAHRGDAFIAAVQSLAD